MECDIHSTDFGVHVKTPSFPLFYVVSFRSTATKYSQFFQQCDFHMATMTVTAALSHVLMTVASHERRDVVLSALLLPSQAARPTISMFSISSEDQFRILLEQANQGINLDIPGTQEPVASSTSLIRLEQPMPWRRKKKQGSDLESFWVYFRQRKSYVNPQQYQQASNAVGNETQMRKRWEEGSTANSWAPRRLPANLEG